MIKALPDKWIRKAIYDAINGMNITNPYTSEVISVPCYDYRVTSDNTKNHFVLITTQSSDVEQITKCENSYVSRVTIDVVTSFAGSGNPGSRLLSELIADEIRQRVHNLQLDASSGLHIMKQIETFPNDISTITQNENIFRKLLILELTIN